MSFIMISSPSSAELEIVILPTRMMRFQKLCTTVTFRMWICNTSLVRLERSPWRWIVRLVVMVSCSPRVETFQTMRATPQAIASTPKPMPMRKSGVMPKKMPPPVPPSTPIQRMTYRTGFDLNMARRTMRILDSAPIAAGFASGGIRTTRLADPASLLAVRVWGAD